MRLLLTYTQMSLFVVTFEEEGEGGDITMVAGI